MGHRRNCRRFRWTLTAIVIFSALFPAAAVHASAPSPVYDFDSLNALIRSGAVAALRSQRTGVLSKVPLPSNYSGVRASAIRLRAGTMYDRGSAASTFFLFPPGITPYPFSRRIALVFFNLGEVLSPRYFQVPGYSLVAPVIGFSAYDAAENFADPAAKSLILTAAVGSILVRFPHTNANSTARAGKMRCVKFAEGGLVQFRNITDDLICETEGGGQFAVVAEAEAEEWGGEKKEKVRRAMVIAAAAVGAVCVVVIVVTSYKMARSSSRRMEGEAENGVAFDTTWVGRTKMPSASMVRTQPTLEHGYIP